MKVPPGKLTNGLALLTSACFLLLFLTGYIEDAAVLGGFIAARVGDGTLIPAEWSHLAVPLWLTPLSATFIHANWLHLGFNMLMLVFCGRHVEHVVGKWLTLGLYVAGAYASAAAEWLADPNALSPMVGASGAISALLGTYALLYSKQEVRSFGPISSNMVRAAWLAAGWIAIQLMIGLATRGEDGVLGHIAIAAHIGGFIAGLLLTKTVLRIRFRARRADLA